MKNYHLMSQHYLSQDALNALKIELQERKTVQRAELSEQIGSAKELGDLSENFEYHDAKERQGQNETRILEIEDMLRNIVLVESKSGGSKIMLGTTFKAKSGNIEKTFEIVGASESDPINGKISNESPLGNAFLGLAAGDIASITTPAGKIEYKVISID